MAEWLVRLSPTSAQLKGRLAMGTNRHQTGPGRNLDVARWACNVGLHLSSTAAFDRDPHCLPLGAEPWMEVHAALFASGLQVNHEYLGEVLIGSVDPRRLPCCIVGNAWSYAPQAARTVELTKKVSESVAVLVAEDVAQALHGRAGDPKPLLED